MPTRGHGAVLDLEHMAERFGGRRVYTVFGVVSGTISMLIIAVAAWASHQPLLFPSLASTAFLIFNRPRADAAAPRAIVLGHLSGAIAGTVGLAATGLVGARPAVEQLTGPRVVAIGVAVGITTALLLVLRAPHPPGASTAMLVALGIITSTTELVALAAGIVVLTVQGYVIDHLVGLDYPVWAGRSPESPPSQDR